MQKVPSRLVSGVLGPSKFRAEFHQFKELASDAGYFNFQGFSRSKIANIFQGFSVNFSSIFYPSRCLDNNTNIGLLSLQTIFPFS